MSKKSERVRETDFVLTSTPGIIMHRDVMIACCPWFCGLLAASALVLILVQRCGTGGDWRRLKLLGSCESGAVQSLSLVLTLPVFLMLVLFIVQISQIMIGIMVVHYAAFAGARAASVWIPSEVGGLQTFTDGMFSISGERPQALEPANLTLAWVDGGELLATGAARIGQDTAPLSFKFQKVHTAALLPCLTISPSRDLVNATLSPELLAAGQAIEKLYPQLDQYARFNQRMPKRLKNKLIYASRYTTVDLIWQNIPHPVKDIMEGPTYNPYAHPAPQIPRWKPNEVGFRDPVTVVVRHQFALLPGIGRILARPMPPGAGTSLSSSGVDRVAGRITRQAAVDNLYTLQLEASATFVNEGYKSVLRYVIHP